jgi:flagellar protein FlbT
MARARLSRRKGAARPKGDINHDALAWDKFRPLCLAALARSFGDAEIGPAESRTMPLKLSLKPGEKFVLNGAVVQNGDRRSALLLQNKASVLREKDIMQAEEANTPSRRIYFPVMMMYLDPSDWTRYQDEFVQRLSEFMSAVRNPEILTDCVNISRHVMTKEYYKALMLCRKLIDYEDERLGNVAPRLSAGSAAG